MSPELLEAARVAPPAYAPARPAPHALELDLFGFAALLLRNLRFILGCGLLAFLVTAAVMLHAKPRFAATATMIVPQGNITSGALSAQISRSTMDLLGGGYELYGDIILSRTVADRLIRDYDLKRVYGVTKDEDAEAILFSVTRVDPGARGPDPGNRAGHQPAARGRPRERLSSPARSAEWSACAQLDRRAARLS